MREPDDGHNGEGRCTCSKCMEAMKAKKPQPREYDHHVWAQIMEDEIG